MGKIIDIVGNTGSGKTTLAQSLVASGKFASGIEQNLEEHPFQASMSADPTRYGLPNQMDFLLMRAEQELRLRQASQPGVLDGGLEEDFFLFTHLFHRRGFLNQAEFGLCERLFQVLRASLGQPDLILWLDVPVAVAAERYRQRGRRLEIAQQHDLDELEGLLHEWLDHPGPVPVVRLDGRLDSVSLTRAALAAIEEKR